jgi:hypothetical protein
VTGNREIALELYVLEAGPNVVDVDVASQSLTSLRESLLFGLVTQHGPEVLGLAIQDPQLRTLGPLRGRCGCQEQKERYYQLPNPGSANQAHPYPEISHDASLLIVGSVA